MIRADSLSGLTTGGWDALLSYGVRTVIDLRSEDEREKDIVQRPASLNTICLPLDVSEDREFWGEWESGPQFGTPLYYRSHIERFPQRNAEVISVIANAGAGGVAFHCVGGRDRSGQVAMLLLALVGADSQDVAADYVLSIDRLRSLYLARGEEDQGPALEAFLRDRGTTAAGVIIETLKSIDVEAMLRKGGLSSVDLQRLRARMLDT